MAHLSSLHHSSAVFTNSPLLTKPQQLDTPSHLLSALKTGLVLVGLLTISISSKHLHRGQNSDQCKLPIVRTARHLTLSYIEVLIL